MREGERMPVFSLWWREAQTRQCQEEWLTMPDNIVIGQKVNGEKVSLARSLRRGMTPAEKTLWQELRANRLGGWHFRRQQVIAGFIVDFYCHQASLAIELDGIVHQEQAGYDEDRDTILSAKGIKVMRFPNARVETDLAGLLRQIWNVCRSTKLPDCTEGYRTYPPTPSRGGKGRDSTSTEGERSGTLPDLTPNPFPRREGERRHSLLSPRGGKEGRGG
jgi:very-short-patch-repair endonuclease